MTFKRVLYFIISAAIFTNSPANAQYGLFLNEQITDGRRNAIVTATEIASPAVVSISIVRTETYGVNPFFQDFFPQRQFKRQLQGLGSGFIYDASGMVITNEHVIHGAEQINIVLTDARSYTAKIVGSSTKFDIALLKIDTKDKLPWINLGDSDDLLIGEWAIAIGNPFGYLLEDTNPSVTVGVISATHRDFKHEDERIYEDMIQTDAAINPGNSGGPLVNAKGEVIGVNTFIVSRSGGNQGIGFALPINRIKDLKDELITYGTIRNVWVGIYAQNVNEFIAEGLNLKNKKGILINNIDPGSPADKAKLKVGDLIIKLNNLEVYDVNRANHILGKFRVGDKVSIVVERDRKIVELEMKLEENKS